MAEPPAAEVKAGGKGTTPARRNPHPKPQDEGPAVDETAISRLAGIPSLRRGANLKSEAEEHVLWPHLISVRYDIIAVSIKGDIYEFILETLSNNGKLMLKSKPISKKVLVLIHNEKVIFESVVIVQYVDNAWLSTGPVLLPLEMYSRATARFCATYINDNLSLALNATMKAPTEIARSKAADLLASQLQLLKEAFRKTNERKGFFSSTTISCLDIALGSYLGCASRYQNS